MSPMEEELLTDPIELEAQERGNRTYGIFPIANCETKKIIYLGLLGLVLTFAYSSSRELKDSYFLEVMPSSSVPYIKLLFVLPLNILVNIFISILLNRFTIQSIFSAITIFYSIFFALMGFILIPYRRYLQISIFKIIDFDSDNKPKFFGFAINILLPIYLLIGNWVVSLNYCLIETFSSTLYSFLMYAFFNTICEIDQFKRFISIIIISCNFGTISSGLCLMSLSKYSKTMSFKNIEKMFYGYFIAVSVFCLIAYFLQYLLTKNTPVIQKTVKRKKLPSILHSIKVLLNARVILAFSATVIFYNFIVNIIEMEYKANTQRYQSVYLNGSESFPQVSFNFQSKALLITGCTATLIMLSSLKNSVKTFGWTLVGMTTPIFLSISAVVVFVLSIINFTQSSPENSDTLSASVGNLFKITRVNPENSKEFMKTSIWIYCVFVALSKAVKYAFFDVSKENFSMEINKDDRPKYKSIYDGVCGKLGKSIASVYLLVCKGVLSSDNCNEFTPINLVFSVIIISLWIVCVMYVGKSYNTAVNTGKPLDLKIISQEKEQSVFN